MQLFRFLSVFALLASLTACDEIADTSVAAADSSKRVIYDAKERWKDLLTYRPDRGKYPPLPQTRYCYRMQADIVCYDNAQPKITAPMVGYQDGHNVSWYQRGGGSVGFSGGPATADVNYPTPTPPQAVAAEPVSLAPTDPITVTSNPPPFKPQVK